MADREAWERLAQLNEAASWTVGNTGDAQAYHGSANACRARARLEDREALAKVLNDAGNAWLLELASDEGTPRSMGDAQAEAVIAYLTSGDQ